MQICKLTIVTVADGQENKISRMGKIEWVDGNIYLYYKEENAQVNIMVGDKRANIERIGDYSLCLCLVPNQMTEGTIGIAGNEGKISVFTFLVDCHCIEKKLEIHLHYQLLFGEEPQTMKLSLTAETKGSIYERNQSV